MWYCWQWVSMPNHCFRRNVTLNNNTILHPGAVPRKSALDQLARIGVEILETYRPADRGKHCF